MQQSLARLRHEGWLCHIVEHWNPYAKIRQDAFSFGDILAVHPDRKLIALVQTTTASNFSARLDKILSEPKAAIWRTGGGLIFVHGWAKRGPRGERKLWQLREVILEGEKA